MFYDNLKFICEQKGLKITPIVLECGGTKGVIGGWKKGAAPNSDIVMKLAVRLDVPTDLLLFGKEICSSSKNLSENEQEMLNIFSKFNPIEQAKLIGKLEGLYRYKQIKESKQLEKSDTANIDINTKNINKIENSNAQEVRIASRSINNDIPERSVVDDYDEVFSAPDATDEY